ncbi:hypothetical protein AB1207_24385 [Kineococcus endophyticus]|uniref:PEGA domain-containing protein n=1 Tax=Kineococcus endophyticus TaxID=1181883 RepID=A0ABV3PE16_9ACTN
MPKLTIKTGLTRWRMGMTSWRGGGLTYYLDGQPVGSHIVTVYRPIRLPIAVGEHLMEVRQTGTRDGYTVTARLSFVVPDGVQRVIVQARPARRWWVSSTNVIDDIKISFRPRA